MKLTEKMTKMLNDQVNAEFYSSYLYLSMSAWLSANDLIGMAGWMAQQAKEEQEHGMKFFNYLLERGEKPCLTAIEAPKTDWADAKAVFEEALGHERHVSELLSALMDQARADRDYPTEKLLSWYLEEQVEEEDTASRNVYLLGLAKDATTLHLVDKEFAARRG